MNCRFFLLTCLLASAWTCVVGGAEPQGLIGRATDSGTVVGYKDTPTLPATDGKYHVHDPDRPLPRYVDPGPEESGLGLSTPPGDAIVLLDGKGLSQWEPSNWKVADGWVEAGDGSLQTKQAFGDCQLHLQWMAPNQPDTLMNRGNSGVLLMGLYEIQIFDSHPMHDQQIYPDGQAASVYGQTPPLVNACRKPGQWQSYDILFSAPVFVDGQLSEPARVTVFHNGVLVHWDQPIAGPMAHRVIEPYRPHPGQLPLSLQGHNSPVRFRNIWIRRLQP
jgi:hypothetical protein